MQPVKNKGVTYLLIGAVALVWGIIVYRIFFSEPADDHVSVVQSAPEHEPFDQYVLKEDTFKLALNYRDPFTAGNSAPVESPPREAHVVPSGQIPVKPIVAPINWGVIKYSGYITNPRTKKLVSILTVKGKERMVAEGESLEGVKLLKNKRDSVLLSWMGKQKYIKQ